MNEAASNRAKQSKARRPRPKLIGLGIFALIVGALTIQNRLLKKCNEATFAEICAVGLPTDPFELDEFYFIFLFVMNVVDFY